MTRSRSTFLTLFFVALVAVLLTACSGPGEGAGGFTQLVPDPSNASTSAFPTGGLDDNYHRVDFTDGFTFDFYGHTYTSVYVNTNVGVTFGSGNSDYDVTADGPSQPGIAILWGDLDPSVGSNPDQIDYRQYADHFVVRYRQLPDHDHQSSVNSMTLTLYSNGKVVMSYDTQETTDALVGVFDGSQTGYSHLPFATTINGYSSGSGSILFDRFGSGPTLTANQLNGTTITFNP